MPTSLDAKTFSETGVLALRGFVPRALTSAAHEAVLTELERLRFKVNGKIVSSKIASLPVFQQTTHLGAVVKIGAAMDRLFTHELLSAMTMLAGSVLKPSHPQLLLSLPHKEEWSLRNLNWHLDLAPPKPDRLPGIQAFVLIDEVRPQGGATLALAGSHRLHEARAGESAHGLLRQDEGFMSSPEKFLSPQEIHGRRIQIVEMSGRAGDVFLMDLRVLHSPSINARKGIRMMATNRFLLS